MFKKALILGALAAIASLVEASKEKHPLDPSKNPVVKKKAADEAAAAAAKKKAEEVIPTLRPFNGKNYKILQFTDLHLGENEYAD